MQASDEIAYAFDMEGYELMDTRGSVTVDQKGHFSNAGEARELIFAESLASYELSAGISFPQTFSGQLWTSGNDLMFDFPVAENSFHVELSNSVVNNRFGGPVRQIISKENSGIIGLENGCIQVPYKTSLLENIEARAAGTAALLGSDVVVELVEYMTQEDFGSDYFCNPPSGPHCPNWDPPSN